MNIVKLAALALTLAGGLTSVQAQTADEVIDKHIAAIGGSDTWNSISSMRKNGTMSVQGMEITYNETIVKGKGMRTDINAMGMENYVIVTEKEGWMYMPIQGSDKVTPLPEEQVKAAQAKLDIKSGMLADRSDVAKTEYVGKDTLSGVACHKVKITDKAGNEQINFFDANTFYIVRTEITVKVQEEEKELAISYSDFKKLPEGITMPMVYTSPMGVGDITIKSVEINKPVDESIFKPAAGK